MTERLNASAARNPESLRGASVDFTWPSSADEYRDINKHVVVLVAVVSQSRNELPLKRVYIRTKAGDVTLEKLGSEMHAVAKDSLTYVRFGPYREDSFYIAPAHLMAAEGKLLADWAEKRNEFVLYQLPGTTPEFIINDRNRSPVSGIRPNMNALKKIIEREYPGYKWRD